MRIVTYNVNGISARLPNLLRWLDESAPDVVCLQELKAPQEKFPELAIRAAGYGVIWHGQKSWNGVAILARGRTRRRSAASSRAIPRTSHSRYIEAQIDGMIVGCLYLPNGNPAPGPKFDYKLRWLERFTRHAAELVASTARQWCSLATTTSIPTERDVYKPERWVDDALFRVGGARGLHAAAARRAGPMRFGHFTRTRRSTRSGTIFATPTARCRACASIICCLIPRSPAGSSKPASIGPCAAGKKRATTRRPGSSCATPR